MKLRLGLLFIITLISFCFNKDPFDGIDSVLHMGRRGQLGLLIQEMKGYELPQEKASVDSEYCVQFDFKNKKLRVAYYEFQVEKKDKVIEIPLYREDDLYYFYEMKKNKVFIYIGMPTSHSKKKYLYVSTRKDNIKIETQGGTYDQFNKNNKEELQYKYTWGIRDSMPIPNPNDWEHEFSSSSIQTCIEELPAKYKESVENYERILEENRGYAEDCKNSKPDDTSCP